MNKPLLVTLFVLFICRAALAQTGDLRGSVRDAAGTLPDALVKLLDTEIATMTDIDGKFSFAGLRVGKYRVVVEYLGYQNDTLDADIVAGQSLDLGAIVLRDEAAVLQTVEVRAVMKEGENRAINMTRNSDRIVNVLAAAGIGKLPDKNAAEALQRIPAIALERDQGEGRYVSVRGTPHDWSASLINGDRMPVANEENDSRTLSFDIFPAELIQYIVVSKSLTPDIEADAIGGSVNFITKTAPESRVLNAKLAGGYQNQVRNGQYSASLTYGDRSKDKKFGFLVSGSWFDRTWGTDNYEVVYGSNTDHRLSRLELRDYTGRRQTLGLNASAEYQPNENVKVYVKGVHGNFTDNEVNRKMMFLYRLGTGDNIEIQNIHNIMKMRFWGGEAGANVRFSQKVKLDLRVASYHNKFNYGAIPYENGDPRNGYHVVRFQLTAPTSFRDLVFVDSNASDIAKFIGNDQIGLFPIRDSIFTFPNGQTTLITYPDLANPAGPGDDYRNIQPIFGETFDASDFVFIGAYSELNNTREQDPIVAQADLSWDASPRLKFKFGGKFRMKDGEKRVGLHKWGQNNQINFDPILLGNQPNEPLNTQGGFLQELGSPYENSFYSFLTVPFIDSFVRFYQNRLIENQGVTQEEAEANAGGSYAYKENVAAAYAMVSFSLSEKFSINGGLRAEFTDLQMTGDTILDVLFNQQGIITIVSDTARATNRYLSLFPSVQMRWSPVGPLNLRLAVTRSMRRPNFNETRPGSPYVQFTSFLYEQGNPNLRPSYSWNFDLIAEYYFGNTGMISVGGFYKHITDHIFGVNSPRPIAYDKPVVIFRTYENANNSFVAGLEFNVSRRLDFLPGFLNGFGINANYTFIHSGMNVPGRTVTQPLPRQARHLYNLALFYEKYGLTARVALNYKGSYLMEVNSYQLPGQENEAQWLHNDTEYDLFMAAFTALDANVSYAINKHFSVFLEANNLLNTPMRVYRGIPERPVQTEYYSWRGQLGFTYSLE